MFIDKRILQVAASMVRYRKLGTKITDVAFVQHSGRIWLALKGGSTIIWLRLGLGNFPNIRITPEDLQRLYGFSKLEGALSADIKTDASGSRALHAAINNVSVTLWEAEGSSIPDPSDDLQSVVTEQLESAKLLQALSNVAPFQHKQDLYFNLHGVLWECESGDCKLVASDGKTLLIEPFDVSGIKGSVQLYMHYGVVQALLSLKTVARHQIFKVVCSDSMIRFESGTVIVEGSLPAGGYANYKSILSNLPDRWDFKIQWLATSAFRDIGALKSTISKDGAISLKRGGNYVTVKSDSIEQRVSGIVEGSGEVQVKLHQFLRCLKPMTGTCTLSAIVPKTLEVHPIVISDSTGRLALLMPLRS